MPPNKNQKNAKQAPPHGKGLLPQLPGLIQPDPGGSAKIPALNLIAESPGVTPESQSQSPRFQLKPVEAIADLEMTRSSGQSAPPGLGLISPATRDSEDKLICQGPSKAKEREKSVKDGDSNTGNKPLAEWLKETLDRINKNIEQQERRIDRIERQLDPDPEQLFAEKRRPAESRLQDAELSEQEYNHQNVFPMRSRYNHYQSKPEPKAQQPQLTLLPRLPRSSSLQPDITSGSELPVGANRTDSTFVHWTERERVQPPLLNRGDHGRSNPLTPSIKGEAMNRTLAPQNVRSTSADLLNHDDQGRHRSAMPSHAAEAPHQLPTCPNEVANRSTALQSTRSVTADRSTHAGRMQLLRPKDRISQLVDCVHREMDENSKRPVDTKAFSLAKIGAKVVPPEKYSGEENNVEALENWAFDIVRWFRLIGLLRSEYRTTQVMMMGQSLKGDASEWFRLNVEIGPSSIDVWGVTDVISGLRERFIHKVDIQDVATKFEMLSQGQMNVEQLYNELEKLAQRMIEYPGDYMFARRFFSALLPHIRERMTSNGFSPEEHSMETLKQVAIDQQESFRYTSVIRSNIDPHKSQLSQLSSTQIYMGNEITTDALTHLDQVQATENSSEDDVTMY